MPPSIDDTNHICLRKHSRPLFFNNSNTFLGLSAVCTMSDLSSSNFSNWIWWNTFDQNCFHPGWFSAPSSKSHYAPDSIFEEALIDKKIKRGKKAQTFSIYTHIEHTCIILCAHCFWCALCKFDMDNVEYELKACWNMNYWQIEIFITYMSLVFCWSKLALTKMLKSRNLKLQNRSRNIHEDSHQNQLFKLKYLNGEFQISYLSIDKLSNQEF